MLKNKNIVEIIFFCIIVISTLMHFQHFNKELVSNHSWRQTQTQSTINSFYKEDMNILNPRRNERGNTEGIFRMEFPIMQWIVACLYKIFGNHLIISRIFMFVIGLLSVFGIYKLLDTLFQNKILAIIGAWAFNFSPSFYYYTINPLPDNFALCFSIWGLIFFFLWYSNNSKIFYLVLTGLFLSIGALAKLPFIIYFIIPIVHFAILLIKNGINKKWLLQTISCFSFALLPLAWYLYVINGWEGNPIVGGILTNEKSFTEVLSYWKFNLMSTLPELLLNYGSVIPFLLAFFYIFKNKVYKNTKFILLISLSIIVLVYYFFEANAIGKNHDYYLFPFYPLLFILVAYGAFNLYNSKNKFLKYFALISLFLLPVFCHLRMKDRWNLDSPGFNKDLLIYKNELRNAIQNDALVVAGNDESHFRFLYYIDKKGWGFQDDNLNAENLKIMIDNGAEYLYTDSNKIIENQDINNLIENIVLKKGSIKILKLKK
ncbi:MAG: glycosyltransferase family 39 protein [Bacteroidales bacterium]|jgi:hypothetical protein|nr:glycosyltransferase family 39 protein [Bacteroidales bacterium]